VDGTDDCVSFAAKKFTAEAAATSPESADGPAARFRACASRPARVRARSALAQPLWCRGDSTVRDWKRTAFFLDGELVRPPFLNYSFSSRRGAFWDRPCTKLSFASREKEELSAPSAPPMEHRTEARRKRERFRYRVLGIVSYRIV